MGRVVIIAKRKEHLHWFWNAILNRPESTAVSDALRMRITSEQ